MSEIVRTDLRIPRDVHEWIKQQAVTNMRSWNAEAAWHLRQRMAQECEQAKPGPLHTQMPTNMREQVR